MGSLEVVLLLVALLTWFYWWSTRTFSYWKDRGVASPKPVPFFGNSFDALSGRMSQVEILERTYKELRDRPLAGTYSLRTPIFFAHKPELIRAILIKDFEHFYNRGTNVDTKLDTLSAHLVHLEDEKWKNLRNKLTAVFSSGKLRMMEEKMIDCAKELVKYIESNKRESLEAKDIMSRFAMNVILAVAFGLQVDVINDPNSRFRMLGLQVFKTTRLSRLRLAIRSTMPRILSILRWRSVSSDATNFFIQVIKDTVKYRESTGVEGKDFLQLLINLRKEDNASFSNIVSAEGNMKNGVTENGKTQIRDDSKGSLLNDQIMLSNCFVFFNAGFETTATTLSFCLFELSRNQDIQERLYREIKETLDKNDGQQSYDILKQITYMDQVVNETLRRWPPAPNTLRVCTKDYRIPESDIIIKKGGRVSVPIYPIHHDPQYWPNPSKFDPERFSPEKKADIVKGTFLPFGDGPRICIGMRFALYEIKVALANLVMSFKVTLNPKTKLPITFNKRAILLSPESGIWLNFENR